MRSLTQRPEWDPPSVWSYGEVMWDRGARGGTDTTPSLRGFQAPPGNRVLMLPAGTHLVTLPSGRPPRIVELRRSVPCVIGGSSKRAQSQWGTATDPWDKSRPYPIVTVPTEAVTGELRTIPPLLQDARGRNAAFCRGCLHRSFPTSREIDACPPDAYGTLCARMVESLSL